jgi:hypothetical protein
MIEKITEKSPKIGPTKCAHCGRDLKAPENQEIEKIRFPFCRLCYVEMMYPLLRVSDMERFEPKAKSIG